MGADEQSPTQRRRVESSRVPTRTSPETTPMRLSPAIDSSPPIPIGFLSLTTRSFLPFSLTTPIPIHFSSPYPYPFRFCLVAFCYGLFVLFLFVHVYIIALWHLASVVSVLEPIYGFSAMKRASRITVDPASGDQPLFNEDKLIVVTVNGEIYNHEDLRKQLTNHTSRTGSDCDVIAHLTPLFTLYSEFEASSSLFLIKDSSSKGSW
ncbi:hypothetical protein ACJW30_05G186000 [Castanea mollissima]